MKFITRSQLAVLGAAVFFSWSTCVSAAQLALSKKPLTVSQAIDPNIMIVFDTSGSMTRPDQVGDYDSGTTYLNSCSGAKKLDNSSSYTYYPSVARDGSVKINVANWNGGSSYTFNSAEYIWGAGSGNKCFGKNSNYYFFFVKDDGSAYEAEEYISGNFLNWYFSNLDQSGPANFGSGNVQREGVGTRNQVARRAMGDLIGTVSDSDRLQNVRVGLAGFNSNGGQSNAKLIVKLGDIDTPAHRATLLSEIDELPANGSTPLATVLASIGRYFVDGNIETLNVKGVETSASDLFSVSPDYSSHSLSEPVAKEVMQYSCQKSFIVSMTDGVPFRDYNYSDTLAKWADDTVDHSSSTTGDFDDIAQALYDLDLRPTSFPNDKNNVTTYPIAFSLDLPMLQRAADNAGGEYYSAGNASQLNTALRSIINNVQAQIGTFGSVAFNSGQLTSNSAVYQAQFNTGAYSGSLFAYELSDTGVMSNTYKWNAATKLDSQAVSNRVIYTLGVVSSVSEGVLFDWSSLTSAQQDDLGYTSSGTDATLGQKVLDYIRGDRSEEGTEATDLRVRSSALGDIVNSTPVFVGAPELNWPEYSVDDRFGSSTSTYSDFKSGAVASRTEMIYVGANDGMLHGFSADVSGSSGGYEELAYVPGSVYASSSSSEGLHYLADQNYEHLFYADLSPSVSDVFIESSWRTILVGGLRSGGRGFFALDITSPSSFNNTATAAANTVLWEFTNTVDSDLGYSYSQPSIVMMANGRWAAIVGNGYNSDDEEAHLFIVFLDGGLDGEWTDGSGGTEQDYIKLSTDTSITSNGLSTPRVVDTDGDSVADRVYAGDLQGNMWVFDISASSVSSWGSAFNSGSTPLPLFTAHNGSEAQSITAAPILASNPTYSTSVSNEPNVLVLFGTGKFLEAADTDTNMDLMSFYGVWDAGTSSRTRTHLEKRELVTDASAGLRTISGDAVDWATQYGWYMDLENQSVANGSATILGERVVTDPLLRREVLLFNSIIPDDVICSGGGTGWLMAINYLTGKAPTFATFDANNDGDIDSEDLNYVGQAFVDGLPSKSGVLGDKQYTPGSDGDITVRDISVGKGGKEGLLSWEEIFRN